LEYEPFPGTKDWNDREGGRVGNIYAGECPVAFGTIQEADDLTNKSEQ
jgi:hypothetical protein